MEIETGPEEGTNDLARMPGPMDEAMKLPPPQFKDLPPPKPRWPLNAQVHEYRTMGRMERRLKAKFLRTIDDADFTAMTREIINIVTDANSKPLEKIAAYKVFLDKLICNPPKLANGLLQVQMLHAREMSEEIGRRIREVIEIG